MLLAPALVFPLTLPRPFAPAACGAAQPWHRAGPQYPQDEGSLLPTDRGQRCGHAEIAMDQLSLLWCQWAVAEREQCLCVVEQKALGWPGPLSAQAPPRSWHCPAVPAEPWVAPLPAGGAAAPLSCALVPTRDLAPYPHRLLSLCCAQLAPSATFPALASHPQLWPGFEGSPTTPSHKQWVKGAWPVNWCL